MPRTKTGEFNQIAYQTEFNKRNYDRIEIKVPKGRKAVIVAAATAAGQSVTEFISQAIDEKMGSGGQESHRERIRNRKNRQGGRKSRPAIKTATPTMGGVRVRSP